MVKIGTNILLTDSLPIMDKEEIERAMLLKYYKDSIVKDNNEIIDLSNYNIEEVFENKFSLSLPNNKNIYYYDSESNYKYDFLYGSKKILKRKYMDQMRIIDISISYKVEGTLEVIPFIVEYYESEIIDILEMENNQIKFQPNDQTDAYEILFKFSGEGIIYNFDVIQEEKQREILAENKIKFAFDDLFLNKNFINFNSETNDEYLYITIPPNDKKHIYISYLEKNNKYSELPKNEILTNIDLNSNLLIDIDILKDQTLEFIPMLIEYDDDKKIGIKNLNFINPDVITLKSETEKVRLAFRISGAGDFKLNSMNVISLEELPINKRLDFNERSDVIKLLSPKMKIQEFKVASIMDEFTYNSFNPEVQMHRLDSKKWKSELLFIQPDLVFIESAWVGNNGAWHKKVAYYGQEEHKEIRELISFSQNLNIPVVFWNKEDPVHYDRFIETAKLCDFVFTTDKGRVKHYKKDCGHNNVSALPFAAQPKIHNPIKIQKERDPRVSFAGSYYRHHEERSKDMDILLEGSKETGLVIYDRNYEKTRKGQMPNHKYPEQYEPYIAGTLPFNLIDKSYKGYKYMINVNTVKHSETMFSRRVFEGLLSGTPIISTYSLGMKRMFGDIINASSTAEGLRLHLNELDSNDELYNKYALRGIREVLMNHTYEKRMKTILNSVGYNTLSDKTNVYFLCFIENDSEIAIYKEIFDAQTILNKKLIIIHKNIKDYKYFYNTYNASNVHGFDFKALEKYINMRQLLGDGYIAVLNKNHFYAENYALDLILAKDYANAEIIGKSKYYTFSDGNLTIINEKSDFEYSQNLLVDRTIIDVSVFDKSSVNSALPYLENEVKLSDLAPYGPKMFSSDSLNFIEDGADYSKKERVII